MPKVQSFVLSLCLALLSLFALPLPPCYAQPPGIDTVHIPGFHYDSRFLIGLNCVSGDTGLIHHIWNALRPDYTYTYGGPNKTDMDEYRDSTWTTKSGWEKFTAWGKADYWLSRVTYPIKAVYAPGEFRTIGNDAMSTENFYQTLALDTLERKWINRMGATPDSVITFPTQMLNAGEFNPCEDPPCDVAIAGFGNHTCQALLVKTVDLDSLYARTGTPGSVNDFDVSFTIRADTNDQTGLGRDDIPDSSVIAYAILYRRDTTAQTRPGAPLCALFVPFDSVAITKGLYLDSTNVNVHLRSDPVEIGDSFREFYFPVVFPHDTKDTLLYDSAITTYTRPRYDTTRKWDAMLVPPDSVIDHIDTVILTLHDTIRWGSDTGVAWHSYVPNATPFGYGAGDWLPYCAMLDSVLIAEDVLPPGTINYANGGPDKSDFVWVFHTTSRVRIDFLSGRFARHTYQLLQRGDFDSLLAADIDAILDDPLLDTTVFKIGMTDEIYAPRIPAAGMANARAARYLQEREPENTRGLWVNPQADNALTRISFGDLDSTDYKPMQAMAWQSYFFGGTIPIYYANPDKMAWEATRDYYKETLHDYVETNDDNGNHFVGDTLRPRYIMGPSIPDYEYYLAVTQSRLGGTTSKFSTLAGISRTWFRRFKQAVPYPVTAVVQIHGNVNPYDNDSGYKPEFTNGWRPTTPEEITAQCWLALNAGIDGGILFSDFSWEGTELGVMNGRTLDDTTEYDTLSQYPDERFTGPGWTLPKMWIGFGTRFAAVKNVVDEFRDHILPVYTGLDLYNGINVCVQTVPNWDTIPVLAGVRAERVVRDNPTVNVPTGVYDAPDSTYLEVSIFPPTARDTADYVNNSKLLVVTNCRLWPVDTSVYSQSARNMLDSLAIFDTDSWEDYDSVGFGRIDVRRPVIVLKNSSGVIADSLVIEKVGHEGEWSQRMAYGDTIQLDFLDPGWGCMYRVSPVPAQISDLGTAYNNGVRSENPSRDTLSRDRLLVYQRDSVVYMRTVDAVGAWSNEVMISSPGDTVIANGKRLASNFFPTIATSRSNEGFTRIVWERRDTLGRHSVESLLLIDNPVTRFNLASLAGSSYRQTLLPPTVPVGPPNLTPVIVGIYDTVGTGGFVVAWAGPDTGITVMAIRELTEGITFLAWQDAVSIQGIHANIPLNSICQYPTLAHFPRFGQMNGASGTLAGSDAEKGADPLTSESLYWYNVFHLAYQQGDGVESVGEQIFYHPVGVIFPSNLAIPPGLFVGNEEPVTAKIDACSFLHPSIAADSTRIGVAFEIIEANAGQRNIGLRFRDTVGSNQGVPLKAWETTLYRWGGPLTKIGRFLGYGAIYERPSLTEFPSLDSLSLASTPEGGLTWFWRDSPGGVAHEQRLYRFGWFTPRRINDGKHPTMTLVPYLRDNPFEGTSIFHRGTDSSRVAGTNDEGNSVWRYEGRLINTPGNPIGYFSTLAGGSGIVAGATIAGSPTGCNRVRRMDFGIVFGYGSVTHLDDDRHGPGDAPVPPQKPGLPPTFFAPPGDGTTLLDTLSSVSEVVRTSLFVIGNEPVAVRRIAGGGDSLKEWLANYGFDSARGTDADIWVVTELVRAADSMVLWRSDTLSGRGLDTLDNALDELLEVPADEVADSGTVAFIRMRGFATEGVPYDLYGGFRFYTEDSTGSPFLKLVRSREEREAPSGESRRDATLQVRVIPNPARDRAEVRVHVVSAGHVRLSVYNTLGEKLADLPTLEASGAGEYMVEVSVSGVQPGAYLLRVESSNGTEATARFNVVR